MIYLAITLSALILLGLGLTLGIYQYKKSNRLARNRGKTIDETCSLQGCASLH